MQKSDGMNYAPKGKSAPVCRKGEFRVGVIGAERDTDRVISIDDWIRGYTQEMEDFVDAVLFDREPVSGIELARDVVETIYAAYWSAEQGRRIELQ
jgi:predicted dehydrogenase